MITTGINGIADVLSERKNNNNKRLEIMKEEELNEYKFTELDEELDDVEFKTKVSSSSCPVSDI